MQSEAYTKLNIKGYDDDDKIEDKIIS